MNASRLRRPPAALACCLAFLLAVSGCGLLSGGDEAASAAGEQTYVVLAMPDWTGGQATAAMAAHVLENELDVPVELRANDQETSWDELASGGVDAILEDWGALPEKRELYVEGKGNVTDAGALGITGQVGWYVPRGFADAHPDVLRAENLNAFADDLGGELLHADPHYATRDEEIIDDLGLDYRPVAAGSEEALLEEVTEASSSGHPVLTYLWRPHWLHTEVELAQVRLPPEEAYPRIELRKYVNTYFLEHGAEAAAFLRDFSWSEEEQNAVARLIAEDGLTPRGAAERWATNHPERVDEWLGR
ncbi:glycine betaine ABC transporter substrate-binding protein [Streptomyces sp. 6N223]|uniref:glycine betaine ABC transporter substrate-binding protein n=1 Tax=Streptomyces sp. 6N223 TaxID=3457412 RepID=UPI003FD3FA74